MALRVLVVDDDFTMRRTLRQILERDGYQVEVARNGSEAIRLYREAPFDLVITDIIMPEKDGLELIFELRQDFSDVKIIAMSGKRGSGDNSHLGIALQLGARRALAKPPDSKRILDAVAKLIGSADAIDDNPSVGDVG